MSVHEGTARIVSVLGVLGLVGLGAAAIAAVVSTKEHPPVFLPTALAYLWCFAPLALYLLVLNAPEETPSNRLAFLWVVLWLIPTTFSLPTVDGYFASAAFAAGGVALIKVVAYIYAGFRK